ncbi:MAG: hypothetical protein BMS9Abin37_2550 [Acidobacteriota bacterium]|nr:MAG: hypothetical protein BMS9Abin37_2550 [Acidobacteriota bacterium]
MAMVIRAVAILDVFLLAFATSAAAQDRPPKYPLRHCRRLGMAARGRLRRPRCRDADLRPHRTRGDSVPSCLCLLAFLYAEPSRHPHRAVSLASRGECEPLEHAASEVSRLSGFARGRGVLRRLYAERLGAGKDRAGRAHTKPRGRGVPGFHHVSRRAPRRSSVQLLVWQLRSPSRLRGRLRGGERYGPRRYHPSRAFPG